MLELESFYNTKLKKMIKIISGFSAIGKTYSCLLNPFKIIDLETYYFNSKISSFKNIKKTSIIDIIHQIITLDTFDYLLVYNFV